MGERPDRLAAFRRSLKSRGLSCTSQREDIARAFFGSRAHLSVEDLYEAARRINPGISYATVYRTLRLLKELEFAQEQHFGDGHARYEVAAGLDEHHDHMICDDCGAIVEFHDEALESRQEAIAEANGFVLARHRMELYGTCRACRAKTERPGRRAKAG